MSDIARWFKGLPTFTRYWLGLTLGFSILGRFGLLKAHQLILLYEPFIKYFQVSAACITIHLYSRLYLTLYCFAWGQLFCILLNALFLLNVTQIWRPATALFYYPLSPATGFHFMINCYFLYNYSLKLEEGETTWWLYLTWSAILCYLTYKSNLFPVIFRCLWRKTCRLLFHATLQLDMLYHCGSDRRNSGKIHFILTLCSLVNILVSIW